MYGEIGSLLYFRIFEFVLFSVVSQDEEDSDEQIFGDDSD